MAVSRLRNIILNASLLVIIGTGLCLGQAPLPGDPAPGPAVALDILGVVKGGTPVELLRTDLGGSEGPVAASDGSLLFMSGSTITRVDPQGRFSTYLQDASGVTGLAFDTLGRLIGARTDPAQILVLAPHREVLADTINGVPLLRPNDLTLDPRGGIYFSDQPRRPGQRPVPERRHGLLYRSPDGIVRQVADDIKAPNGLVLSPDGRVLYAADSYGEFILAYDIQPDGALMNRRNFGKLQGGPIQTATGIQRSADGLAIDGDGRLYVASRLGVEVFDPRGRHLGLIRIVGGTGPQNLAFAGPNKSLLFVVRRSSDLAHSDGGSRLHGAGEVKIEVEILTLAPRQVCRSCGGASDEAV